MQLGGFDGRVGHVGSGGNYNERSGFSQSVQPGSKKAQREAKWARRKSSLTETIACPSRFQLPQALTDLIANYPLFVVLLYSNRHTKIRDFIHEQMGYIDSASGLSCLIWLPEPVAQLGTELRERWTDRLGTLPDWFQTVLDAQEVDFERVSFALSEDFAIPPDKLPGLIVAEPQQTQYFFDRFNEDADLQPQFDALIASARAAQPYPQKKRTKAFRKEWHRRMQSAERDVLGSMERFNNWCEVIKDTEKNILDILLPIAPLLQSFLSCFTAVRGKP
jgi:hypothetical protein